MGLPEYYRPYNIGVQNLEQIIFKERLNDIESNGLTGLEFTLASKLTISE